MLHNLLKNTYTYRQCKRPWRPCFNGIRLKLIILFTKPYVFESNWMLRTVSLRADPTPRDSQSLYTDVWCACLTFCPSSHSYIKDKFLKSETCLWWLRGAAADETNSSWAGFLWKSQWFLGKKVGNQFKQRVVCREASWKTLSDTRAIRNLNMSNGLFNWANRGEYIWAPPTCAMVCRYSPQRPQSKEKITSRMFRPIRNSTINRNSINFIDNTIMWNPSFFFSSNKFHRTQTNFSPLNNHTIKEFHLLSPWSQAIPGAGILRWLVLSHSGHRRDDCNCRLFVLSGQFARLCNMSEWRKRHRSHTVARFGCNSVCHVTYLPSSPQGRPQYGLSYRGNLQQPVEFKIALTEK